MYTFLVCPIYNYFISILYFYIKYIICMLHNAYSFLKIFIKLEWPRKYGKKLIIIYESNKNIVKFSFFRFNVIRPQIELWLWFLFMDIQVEIREILQTRHWLMIHCLCIGFTYFQSLPAWPSESQHGLQVESILRRVSVESTSPALIHMDWVHSRACLHCEEQVTA